MDIVVCVKQVMDADTPPSGFRIDARANDVVSTSGLPPVINGFDEQAVEAALRLKEAHGGTITVLTLGKDLALDVIRKPLSMGADELVVVWDAAFEGGDSYSTAHGLAAAIRKIGTYDLILCGRQASDGDAGQVGPGIAELLGMPCVTFAKSITATDATVRIERAIPDRYEVVEAPMPCVITVSNELGAARYPTLRGVMAARRKQPVTWNAEALGIDPSTVGAAGARTKVLRLFLPERGGECELVAGDTPEQAGKRLAMKLREAKVI
ncbi:MAG: electron transfer flavoprotein subunit beta/FixA family protein [Candidatus Rokubacteria bacterium]|nr:electron transfer flavoprotein subunit beta/FixA family protein [Candidatus Rokubacteria bacterium]